MKQVILSLRTGKCEILEVPSPSLSTGHLLIQTYSSLLSSGTERMLVDFGKSGFIDKAKKQPHKVKQLMDKVRTDGPKPAIESVQSKLDDPLALGYCNVGVVLSVGQNVLGFSVGDRVISNGPHAEIVSVPHHLCARIPDNVSDQSALFTVLASIGLQGVRLSKPTFGETYLVSGLGLIGLLTGQILIAHGCRVLGLDPDLSKCTIAETFGIQSICTSKHDDPISWCMSQTSGIGVDGVLITASTTSSEPVDIASTVCRQRGRIVLVGVSGLQLKRDLFYKKELSFQVSCSYGPGRYDSSYELLGNDYPIGFVRWTEQRNFSAVLEALSRGSLSTEGLISHHFSFQDAPNAYELLTSSEPSLGIILTYSLKSASPKSTVNLPFADFKSKPSIPALSFIGCGNYSRRILIPAFASAGGSFHTLCAISGIGPVYYGKKFGFRNATTDPNNAISNPSVNAVVIATRHDSHAYYVIKALSARKHVFVEKPLCLSLDELAAIESSYTGDSLLMVGFNRRFAPLTVELKQHISVLTGPKAFVYTCNAGSVSPDHWVHDSKIGGGRLLGEACHFVDLLRFLVDSPIDTLHLFKASDSMARSDTFSLQLRFVDGSIGTIHYFANGHKSFPKERIEVFAGTKVFCLSNFRKLQAWGVEGFRTRRLLSQNKGQVQCSAAFLRSIATGSSSPIPISQIFEVQRLLLQVLD